MPDTTSKFIECINSIIKRPGMYEVNKVEDLSYIILGYWMAQNNTDINDFLVDFRKYVNAKLGKKKR